MAICRCEYGVCVKEPKHLCKFESSKLIKNTNENDNVAVSVDWVLDYFIITMLWFSLTKILTILGH